jgi:hypothetical protein
MATHLSAGIKKALIALGATGMIDAIAFALGQGTGTGYGFVSG